MAAELFAERRINLGNGGRNAFALGVAAGADDVPVGRGLLISAYGQAGVVGLRSHDGFVDGALRIEHILIRSEHGEFRLGGGIWGAAQPRATRLDIGPRISQSLSVGKSRFVIAADWRQRVAGQSRPGSGPVVTLATDF
jgi:hypothetical protein